MDKVITAGEIESRTPQDYNWMYCSGFEDLHGYFWEIFYMGEKVKK